MKKVSDIIDRSKEIILDSCLENGAIVAANPTKNYYSNEAKHYFYVWPRDAAYTIMAANTLGVSGIQHAFFNWVSHRAEDFEQSGLLYEKYYINGLQALNRFQPDQGASLLIAADHCFEFNTLHMGPHESLLKKIADGICTHWQNTHFNLITNDLWEERHTFPDLKENFTYSLAACLAGLKKAHKYIPSTSYEQTINQMSLTLKNGISDNHFIRSFGKLNDCRIDASLLGLIWPFCVVDPDNLEMQNTVDAIISRLAVNGGVHRYEHDEYDGWMYQTIHRKKGAGYWPLLNFWLAIVLKKMNRTSEAKTYFNKVLSDLASDLIPEQIFSNHIQKAVSPLCWSHSMFVLAAEELELF